MHHFVLLSLSKEHHCLSTLTFYRKQILLTILDIATATGYGIVHISTSKSSVCEMYQHAIKDRWTNPVLVDIASQLPRPPKSIFKVSLYISHENKLIFRYMNQKLIH